MKKHKKSDLISTIQNAIKICGWTYELVTPITSHPFQLRVKNDSKSFDLRIYIWNLSHGGGTKRPKHEYRIQVTGISRFEKEKNEKVLILGWWNELEVFAGFDFNKHTSKLGFSPSMQIIEDTLIKANTDGLSTYQKSNDEIAVAFRPDHFMEYVQNLETLHEIEEPEIIDETENETIQFRYEITSYGADYPVDSIVKRLTENVIFVPPFQRNYIWDIKRASRFIESLILGLPVPGIFLSREDQNKRFLIIDGQQRLLSLFAFYTGKFKEAEFTLTGVRDDLEGKKYNDLTTADKNRLNDSIIHATIVKQEKPDDKESSIYLIYERLNTGGKPLNAQEIRATIYYGRFNEQLNEYIKDSDWRSIFGKPEERLKEQELILRFFALYYSYKKYEKPLKNFLNNFMAENRDMEKHSKEKLDKIFFPAVSFIKSALGKDAFRIVRGINAAVYDAVMVGVAKRLEQANINDEKKFKERYNALISNETFGALTRGGTTDDQTVKKRMGMAIKQFKNLK